MKQPNDEFIPGDVSISEWITIIVAVGLMLYYTFEIIVLQTVFSENQITMFVLGLICGFVVFILEFYVFEKWIDKTFIVYIYHSLILLPIFIYLVAMYYPNERLSYMLLFGAYGFFHFMVSLSIKYSKWVENRRYVATPYFRKMIKQEKEQTSMPNIHLDNLQTKTRIKRPNGWSFSWWNR